MSVSSTVLVFAVIPAAFILVVALLVFATSDRGPSRSSRRYRPGRPYDFQPIWYLAAPEQVSPALGGPGDRHAQAPALEAGVVENSRGERVLPGPAGGASDRW